MKRGTLFVVALLCTTAAAAKPVKIEHKSSALDFSYAWPNEAAAIPALDKKLRAEMTKGYTEALATAREDQKMYREQKRTGMQDLYSMRWTSAGETARLLSLQFEFSQFTGGAHPNTTYGSLLWDRKLNRQVDVGALFSRPADLGTITRTAYCKALDKERAKRRQGEKMELAEFNVCPKYSELSIAPVDKSGNGRFDRIAFVASPYTAGPYVEGEYAIFVPVTAKLIPALKPDFQSSFEAQRQ